MRFAPSMPRSCARFSCSSPGLGRGLSIDCWSARGTDSKRRGRDESTSLVDCDGGSSRHPIGRRGRPWTAADCGGTSLQARYDGGCLVDAHPARCGCVYQVVDRSRISGCDRVVCCTASLPVMVRQRNVDGVNFQDADKVVRRGDFQVAR